MDNELRNRKLRERARLFTQTQKELASKMQMSKEHFNGWIKGKKDLSDKNLDKADDLLKALVLELVE